MISEIQELPDGGVECTGTLLNREVGFYAARIAPLNKLTKELKVVGPSNIKFDKSSGNFSVTLPGPLDNFFYNHEDPKVLSSILEEIKSIKLSMEWKATKELM